jgi:two-component system, NarL family, nitrate/nitrite response regulator NarL
MSRVALLVADRHPVVHEGLRMLLSRSECLVIVGVADSGRGAVAQARRLAPDVLLLDERLPDMLCEDAVSELRRASPGTRIVIFTPCVTVSGLEKAARLQVAGLLGKDAPPGRVVEVLSRVAAGEVVADRVCDQALRRAAGKLRCPPLTPREYQILVRAATGASNAEIGSEMYLAPTTVKSYLQSALPKLNARNRVEAVAKLSELELL